MTKTCDDEWRRQGRSGSCRRPARNLQGEGEIATRWVMLPLTPSFSRVDDLFRRIRGGRRRVGVIEAERSVAVGVMRVELDLRSKTLTLTGLMNRIAVLSTSLLQLHLRDHRREAHIPGRLGPSQFRVDPTSSSPNLALPQGPSAGRDRVMMRAKLGAPDLINMNLLFFTSFHLFSL
ncbi:unnamed protein product [Linum trigynum]